MSLDHSLHNMALIVEVARAGSFSRASAHLGMPGATLSRRIAAMETAFGVRLFDRTTRKVRLTQLGERYLERCGQLVDEARIAHELLRESNEVPAGHVRVSLPVDLGLHHVAVLMPAFYKAYPGISVDFDLSSNNRDLVGEHVDIAIRIGPVSGDRLIVRRIGTVQMRLYAAPEYLKQHAPPRQPADLTEHACVTLPSGTQPPVWQLQRQSEALQVSLQASYRANNMGFLKVMAEGALGIAALPTLVAKSGVLSGSLVQVLPDWGMPDLPVHVVMSTRLQPLCVRVFIDFLAERILVA